MTEDSSRSDLERKPRTERDEDDRGFMSGFSLIELMLVIAIISILAAIAFLSMLHYGAIIRVNASARELGGHMRVARAEAISSGQRYLFRFLNSNTYLYGPADGTGWNFAGLTKTYRLQDGILFTIPSGGGLGSAIAVPGHPTPPPCAVDVHAFTSCGNSPSGFKDLQMFRDGTFSSDGVAYMAPSMDAAGTGARDDRMRSVDWSGTTGRVRVWRYFARDFVWQ
jgi:type II secretion system protein H